MNSDTFAVLAAKLTSTEDAPLSADEKGAIVGALSALVTSQGIISRQVRLLKSYQHDTDTLDAITLTSLARFTDRAGAPAASVAYDLARARAARETLLAEIERAQSLEGALARALEFAKAIAVIAA